MQEEQHVLIRHRASQCPSMTGKKLCVCEARVGLRQTASVVNSESQLEHTVEEKERRHQHPAIPTCNEPTAYHKETRPLWPMPPQASRGLAQSRPINRRLPPAPLRHCGAQHVRAWPCQPSCRCAARPGPCPRSPQRAAQLPRPSREGRACNKAKGKARGWCDGATTVTGNKAGAANAAKELRYTRHAQWYQTCDTVEQEFPAAASLSFHAWDILNGTGPLTPGRT